MPPRINPSAHCRSDWLTLLPPPLSLHPRAAVSAEFTEAELRSVVAHFGIDQIGVASPAHPADIVVVRTAGRLDAAGVVASLADGGSGRRRAHAARSWGGDDVGSRRRRIVSCRRRRRRALVGASRRRQPTPLRAARRPGSAAVVPRQPADRRRSLEPGGASVRRRRAAQRGLDRQDASHRRHPWPTTSARVAVDAGHDRVRQLRSRVPARVVEQLRRRQPSGRAAVRGWCPSSRGRRQGVGPAGDQRHARVASTSTSPAFGPPSLTTWRHRCRCPSSSSTGTATPSPFRACCTDRRSIVCFANAPTLRAGSR